MIPLHGGGKPLNLQDPVDQIVIACLLVFLVCAMAMLIAAARAVKKARDDTDGPEPRNR